MDIGTLTGSIQIENEVSGVLNTITNQLKSFSDDWDGIMKGAAVSVGIVTAALAGVTASVIALGNRGAEVDDVSSTFDRFSGSVENADRTLRLMREGTRGVVSDFDLMQKANKLLSAEVKLTSEQFGTMSQAAFVLADQGLGSVEENLSAVSQALLTGRTRALEMKIGKIDLANAEQNFAAKLGVSKEQLNQAGVMEAKRIGILDALNERVKKAGDIQKDFGDITTGIVVAIRNWGDELAQRTSELPSLMTAVNAIGGALTESFGETPQGMIRAIVGSIDRFAQGVTAYAPPIIEALGDVKDTIFAVADSLSDLDTRWGITSSLAIAAQQAWDLVIGTLNVARDVVTATVDAWDNLPAPIQDTITVTAILTATVLAADAALVLVANKVILLAARLLEYRAVAVLVEIATKSMTIAQLVWTAALEGSVTWLMSTTVATRAMTVAQVAWTAVATPMVGVLLALQLNFSVLTARIGLSGAALGAWNIAAYATTAAATILGTALGAVLFVLVPLVVAWGSWKFGEWLASFPAVQRGILFLAEKLPFISQEAIEAKRHLLDMAESLKTPMDQLGASQGWFNMDPVIQALEKRLLSLGIAAGKSGADLDAFVKQGVTKFKDLKDNGSRDVQILTGQLTALTAVAGTPAPALQKVADEARRLKEAGSTLTPELEQLITLFPAAKTGAELLGAGAAGAGQFLKGAKEDAEAFRKKVKEMTDELSGKSDSVKVFESAFKGLSAAQLENVSVQNRVLPQILQYAQAHQGQLTPAMDEALKKILETRVAMLDQGMAAVEASGITLEYIEAQKLLGISQEELAASLGFNAAAFARYVSNMTEARQITDSLVKAQDALVEQQSKLDLQRISSNATAEVQALKQAYDAGLITAQQFATQRISIEETAAAKRLQIQIQSVERAAEIELRELDQKIARGQLENASAAQIQQMRTDILQRFGIQRISLTDTEHDRIRDIAAEGAEALAELQKDYTALVRSESETRIQTQSREIEQEAADRISSFKGTAQQVTQFTALVMEQSTRRRNALFIDNQALVENSRTRLTEIAVTARNTYLAMEADPANYSASVRRHFKNIADEADRQARGVRSAWEKAFDVFSIAGAIADIIPGKFGDMASKVIGHAENLARGLMTALATGNWIDFAMAGIAAIGDAIAGLFRHPGRDAAIAFAESFDTELAGSGFDELHTQLGRLGAAGENMWKRLTTERNEGKVQEIIKEIQEALAALDRDMQRYNLTWKDLTDAQYEASRVGEDLVTTYDRLVDAGFSVERVTERMSADLNQYIIDAVDAGVKIPAAMRPIIESLIEQGQLTAEAAAAIMGLRDSAVPSLDEIRDAAGRYGIELDSLGPKVKQLEITELANQYVADWNILTAATDDWGVLIDKMKPKVQDLITDAIKYGSTLPESMRPMIQAFIDAGALVDENGEKLTDLSKLTFAKDLTKMTEDLIKKLDELIDTINGTGKAFQNLGNTRVNPVRVPYRFEQEGPGIPSSDGIEVPEPEQFSTGGIVQQGRLLQFPRQLGTDTVPAMLTPGEGIVNTAGMARLTSANLNALNAGRELQVAGIQDIGRTTAATAEAQVAIVSQLESLHKQMPKILTPEEVSAIIADLIGRKDPGGLRPLPEPIRPEEPPDVVGMRVIDSDEVEEMMRRFRERAGPGELAPPLSNELVQIPDIMQIGAISSSMEELLRNVEMNMGQDKSVIAEQYRHLIEDLERKPQAEHNTLNRQTSISLGGIHIDGAQFGPNVTPEEVAAAAVEAVKRSMPEVVDSMLDTLDEGGKLQTRAARVTAQRGAA